MQTSSYRSPNRLSTRAVDGRATVIGSARVAERRARQRAPLYQPTPEKIKLLRDLVEQAPSVSTPAQVWRTVAALIACPDGCTVRDLADHADIGDPRRRAKDARDNLGIDIESIHVRQVSPMGHEHRTVLYRLVDAAAAATAMEAR